MQVLDIETIKKLTLFGGETECCGIIDEVGPGEKASYIQVVYSYFHSNFFVWHIVEDIPKR